MPPKTYSQNELTQQILDLGVIPGGVLLVHCSFSKIKPVGDGPLGLIAGLQVALGPAGTLVMPSMTDDDERPFEPETSSCLEMGVVANTFWQMPSVLRSDSPHAFAAIGPEAARITAPHPLDVPHGMNSPVGRVYELDGQVLLLGVGHDANTTVHLAESLAGVRYRRKKSIIIKHADQLVRFDYNEIDHCCEKFNLVDDWLNSTGLQRRGKLGHASARLIRSRDIVEVVVSQLHKNETVFLHPPGVDDQCDQARASMMA